MKHDMEKNKENLLKALERNLGIVTAACKEVNLSRNVFYEYCKNDPEFKAKVDDINEITLDFAESQLLKKIKDGSEKSIMFYMRYKARKRGYNDELNINANIKVEQPLLKPLDKKDDDSKPEEENGTNK